MFALSCLTLPQASIHPQSTLPAEMCTWQPVADGWQRKPEENHICTHGEVCKNMLVPMEKLCVEPSWCVFAYYSLLRYLLSGVYRLQLSTHSFLNLRNTRSLSLSKAESLKMLILLEICFSFRPDMQWRWNCSAKRAAASCLAAGWG